MGDVVKFRKPPRNRGQFRGQGGWQPSPKGPKRPKRRAKRSYAMRLALSLGPLLALAIMWWGIDQARAGETFTCQSASVIDGDTFDCDGKRIRLKGIDAPELPGHCRPGRQCTPGDPYASTESLRRLLEGGTVSCRKTDTDAYGRTVALCKSGAADLSCRQIEGGFAVRRYGVLWC